MAMIWIRGEAIEVSTLVADYIAELEIENQRLKLAEAIKANTSIAGRTGSYSSALSVYRQ